MSVEEQGPVPVRPQEWAAPEPSAAPQAAKRRRRPFRIAQVVLVLGLLLMGVGLGPLLVGFHRYTASSSSMAPGIGPGDLVVVQNGHGAPKRGDLVLVDTAGWPDRQLVFRRVIGVGGDRVACCTAGHVTLDGKPLDEPYTEGGNASMPAYSVTVPAGRLFLLGDNRVDSIDSRMNLDAHQGTLPVADVRGTVVWKSAGGPVDGTNGTLRMYIGLVAFGGLLAGLALVSLLVSAVLAARRRNRRPAA